MVNFFTTKSSVAWDVEGDRFDRPTCLNLCQIAPILNTLQNPLLNQC